MELRTLFGTHRSQVARRVLTGGTHVSCDIDQATVVRAYEAIWQKVDCFRGLGQFAALPVTSRERVMDSRCRRWRSGSCLGGSARIRHVVLMAFRRRRCFTGTQRA